MGNVLQKGFMGLSSVAPADADAVILPVPFERTVTYGAGTSGGPDAIVESSLQLEFYDEETLLDFSISPKLYTFPHIVDEKSESVEDYLKRVEKFIVPLRGGPFLLGLGGEHTVTYGLVKGLFESVADVTVVQIDAHADAIDELRGLRWSHGTVMRRLWDEGCRLIQIGIRSLSRSESELINRGERITTFFAHRLEQQWSEIRLLLRNLKGLVYLTIDVDGLDPSIIPSTGTPQPNGLNWAQTMDVIR
ncbi:MAG: arginase family protein, partial [Thermoguttaceae bacterium]